MSDKECKLITKFLVLGSIGLLIYSFLDIVKCKLELEERKKKRKLLEEQLDNLIKTFSSKIG